MLDGSWGIGVTLEKEDLAGFSEGSQHQVAEEEQDRQEASVLHLPGLSPGL